MRENTREAATSEARERHPDTRRASDHATAANARRVRDAGAGREIEFEAAVLRLREDGILEVVVRPNAETSLEDAQAIHAVMREVCDRPAVVLADIRGLRRSGVVVERYAAGPEVAAITCRLALLVESPVSRMLGNLKMGLAKPTYPTRLFTDEDAAVAWLLEGADGTS